MTSTDRRAGIRRRQKLRNVTQGILLLAILVGLAVLSAWWLFGPGALPWVLGAGVLVGFLRPRVPAWWALRMYGANPIPRMLAPELHDVVGELAERAGLAVVPSIYYVPATKPNAFAVGYGRETVLGVTDGLLRLLGTRELAGVLAHEVSHLRNGDTRIMLLSDVIGRFVQFLSSVGLWSMVLTVPMAVAAEDPTLVLASGLFLILPTVVTLLQLALSRSRELDADLDGATLTGDPEGLARGLLLLEESGNHLSERGTMTRTSTSYPVLLSHPATAVRVERLRRLVPDRPQTVRTGGLSGR